MTIFIQKAYSSKYMRICFYYQYNYTGFENIVRMLIEHGADVNAVSGYNNSILIMAAEYGMYSIDVYGGAFRAEQICKRSHLLF